MKTCKDCDVSLTPDNCYQRKRRRTPGPVQVEFNARCRTCQLIFDRKRRKVEKPTDEIYMNRAPLSHTGPQESVERLFYCTLRPTLQT